jgi:hypothetical protein
MVMEERILLLQASLDPLVGMGRAKSFCPRVRVWSKRVNIKRLVARAIRRNVAIWDVSKRDPTTVLIIMHADGSAGASRHGVWSWVALAHWDPRCDGVGLIDPLLGMAAVGAIRKDSGMKGAVACVVNTTTNPLLHLILRVFIVIP